MTIYDEARTEAQEALAAGRFEEAIRAANLLVDAGDSWLIDGLYRRALALELWADGPPDRLVGAASDWQRLVEIAPSSVSFLGLSRVLLALGDRDAAFDSLLKAEVHGGAPEVFLGFAEFHNTATPPNLEMAKEQFWRAALRGRLQGMRGYVETAMALEQPFRAVAMTLCAVITTPFLALVLGDRRHIGFR
jgi:hypothetical protein